MSSDVDVCRNLLIGFDFVKIKKNILPAISIFITEFIKNFPTDLHSLLFNISEFRVKQTEKIVLFLSE
jgi:hypothetical protein